MSSHRTEELFTANSGAENGASIATAKSTPITKLQCPPAGISAQSMKFLHQLLEAEPELKKIKFSNNPHVFGTSNIEAVFNFSELLQQHRKLGTLEIQECGLDSQGACIIASKLPNLPLLKVLDASLNPLGDEGAEALCSALVSCPLFYDLRMAQCGLTNTGAGYILALLKENPQITDLTLTDNKISDHLIRQIEAQIAINRQKILDMQNPFLNNITSHSRMF
jgi:Ran GTPase-activating protein (RanGAP) involved in mRNA processing and transport